MMIPSITFDVADPSKDAEYLAWFVDYRRGPTSFVPKKFPKLQEMLAGASGEDERKIIEEFMIGMHADNRDALEAKASSMQGFWSSYHPIYCQALSDLLEADWKRDRIQAHIGITPFWPNEPSTWECQLRYDKDDLTIGRVLAEEMLHYIWSDKWMEVFPGTKSEQLRFPELEKGSGRDTGIRYIDFEYHIPWVISEIVVETLLNYPLIGRALPFGRVDSYQAHHEVLLPIGEDPNSYPTIQEHFDSLFLQGRREGDPIEAFMRKAYDEAKRHEASLRQCVY